MALSWLARLRRRSPPPAEPEVSSPDPPAPFHAMTEGTRAQWSRILEADAAFSRDVAGRVLGHLTLLRDDTHGFAVDRLEHALQTATRAHRAGFDEEYVTCALLHDIGAAMSPFEHAAFAATLLKPYVSEGNHWMVEHHDLFQGYHYLHLMGGNRNARNRFRGHRHFRQTVEFCDRFDQAAFDPTYDSMPLQAFEPMVRRVLGQRRR